MASALSGHTFDWIALETAFFLLLEREGQGPVFGKALSLRALICVYQCPLSMSSSRASSPSDAERPPPGTQAATTPLKYNLKLNGAKQIALCLWVDFGLVTTNHQHNPLHSFFGLSIWQRGHIGNKSHWVYSCKFRY